MNQKRSRGSRRILLSLLLVLEALSRNLPNA